MTTEVHSHILDGLHTMLSQTMMGDLTFREPRVVDTQAIGPVIKARALIGVNEWDQPIEYPVTILVVPDLPAEESQPDLS
ncbi:MAG: hypothetical protein KBG29_00285 [Pseudomonadales bacterium]|nr:hypothetical protein [Pseudomonadales bacterium]